MTKLGATGEFPDGKIHQHDEGAINLAIYTQDDNVIVNFGKPVVWVGFPPDTARQMAALLLERANEIDPQGTS